MVISIDSRRAPIEPAYHSSVIETRRRALERLYQRRLVVQNLIRSLEGYQTAPKVRQFECIKSGARRKCS